MSTAIARGRSSAAYVGSPAGQRIKLEESISIGRLAELFPFCRKLDNLSRAMRHVASVDPR